MQGCEGFASAVVNGPAPGSCIACTALANSHFTSDGGVTDSCAFACSDGYFRSAVACLPNVYVVQFQVAVILPAASTFNIRKYMISMASLAGISGCVNTPTQLIANRLYESACTIPTSTIIRATVDTAGLVSTSSYMDRRLLAAAGTADVVTEFRIQSDPVKATLVQQSISVSAVNTLLIANYVGTTVTVSAPTVVIVAIAPTSTIKMQTTLKGIITTKLQIGLETTAAAAVPPQTTPIPPQTTPISAGSDNIMLFVGVGAGVVLLLGGGITTLLCFATTPKQAESVKPTPPSVIIPVLTPSKTPQVIVPQVIVPAVPPTAPPAPTAPAAPVAALFNNFNINNIRRTYNVPIVPQLYPVYPLQFIHHVRKFK